MKPRPPWYAVVKLITLLLILIVQGYVIWSTHERIKATHDLEQRMEQLQKVQ